MSIRLDLHNGFVRSFSQIRRRWIVCGSLKICVYLSPQTLSDKKVKKLASSIRDVQFEQSKTPAAKLVQ